MARIYDGLMDMAARFPAVVDYPDEDIEDLQREQMLDTLRRPRTIWKRWWPGFPRPFAEAGRAHGAAGQA